MKFEFELGGFAMPWRDGHTAGKLLENAVKVYKSHRTIHYTC